MMRLMSHSTGSSGNLILSNNKVKNNKVDKGGSSSKMTGIWPSPTIDQYV